MIGTLKSDGNQWYLQDASGSVRYLITGVVIDLLQDSHWVRTRIIWEPEHGYCSENPEARLRSGMTARMLMLR